MQRSAVRRGVVLVAMLPLLLAGACMSIPGLPDQAVPGERGDPMGVAAVEPCTLLTVPDLVQLDFELLQRVDANGEEPARCRLDVGDGGLHELVVLTVPIDQVARLLGLDPDGAAPESVQIGRHQALRYTELGGDPCVVVIEAMESAHVLVIPGDSGIPCTRTMSVAAAVEAGLP